VLGQLLQRPALVGLGVARPEGKCDGEDADEEIDRGSRGQSPSGEHDHRVAVRSAMD
jgi:hypothetical protein